MHCVVPAASLTQDQFFHLHHLQMIYPLVFILTRCSWLGYLPHSNTCCAISVLHTSHDVAVRCQVTVESCAACSEVTVSMRKYYHW